MAFGPKTVGLFNFIIPALFSAISSKVYPRLLQWSNPILVIMLNIGSHILTASSLPPKPPSAILK